MGERTLISWTSDVELDFHGISYATEFKDQGFWEFSQFEGRYIHENIIQ